MSEAADELERPGWEDALDDPDEPLYPVGVVAELMDVDPQVVRGYDKRGLVVPGRAASGHRRYSRQDIRRLSRAMHLAEEGIPAAGIGRILELEDELRRRDRPASEAEPAAEGADSPPGPEAGEGPGDAAGPPRRGTVDQKRPML